MNNDFIKFANSFQAIARPGLSNIRKLLTLLGNPQNGEKYIHIAGTNGKGSVCAFLQNILTLSGKKTGKYTSPNLVSVCERISIDGKNISENDMERALFSAKEAILKGGSDFLPTQFEIWTAAALAYFKEQKCDISVIETGLGGEMDATNIIPPPLISVITGISADHTEYLGDTLSEIAKAKSGIIKPLSKVVSAPQKPEVTDVLKEKCRAENSVFTQVFVPESKGFDGIYEIFDYGDLKNIKCGLGGQHQIENAAVAIECAKLLKIPSEIIKRGIESAKNIGRFETVSENPLIIFDGAHNPDGITALCRSLNRYFPNKHIDFVMAAMADKDYKKSFEIMNGFGFSKRSLVKTVAVKNNPRSETAEKLASAAKSAGFSAAPFHSIKSALPPLSKKPSPLTDSGKSSEVTVICGSLYLYKDLKDAGF